MIRLECGYGSHPGRVRENNEDSYLAAPELGLWLVADGMGGHQAGEVASAIVVEEVARCVGAGDSLSAAIESAHLRIMASAQEQDKRNMGSTVVALRRDGTRYQICWVGDSRAYLWSGGLRRLTKDHSLVQLLLEAGLINAGEVDTHPGRNVISQGLGVGGQEGDAVRVDAVEGEFAEGDVLLLCSDGVNGAVPDAAIAGILAEPKPSQAKVDRLIGAALDGGGRDNITAIVLTVRAEGPDDQEDRTVPLPPRRAYGQ